jgi:hypothetical protein
MEMTGLWKAWKAKGASPSFHEPLEISPKAGVIPTFPQLRRALFITYSKKHRRRQDFALRLAAGAPRRLRVESNCRQPGEIVVVNAKK